VSPTDAFEESHDAGQEGVDVSDNPFDEDTDERRSGKMVGGRHDDTITMRARDSHGSNVEDRTIG
jgi:hypothetical protein